MVDSERTDILRAIDDLRDDIKSVVATVTEQGRKMDDHEKRLTTIESGLVVKLEYLGRELVEIKQYWAKAMFVMLLALIGLAGGPRLVEIVAKVLGGM
jgi:phage-related minor tail protein